VTEVARLIADMVRAGVDPELIGRAAAALAEREPVLVTDAQAERKRAADRERMRAKRSAMSRDNCDNPVLSSPEVSPQTPFPKPLQSVPPSPPKGGSSPTEIDLAFDAWDEMAAVSGLAKARVRSDARRKRLGTVIRQHGLDTWREACRRVGASSFCRGESGSGTWRADLDFVLQAKSFGRILEGHYDDRPNARGSPPQQKAPQMADVFAFIGKNFSNDPGSEHDDSRSARQAVSYLPASGSER
jgi:hypothetical protein